MPPCSDITAGRPICKLVDIYLHNQALSNYNTVSSDVFTSNFIGLTLSQYCIVREYYCAKNHKACTQCRAMIQAARTILMNGIVPMADVFKDVFPGVTYHSLNAKRRLLQMPIVAFRIKGKTVIQSKLYLMERFDGLDYGQLSKFLSLNAAQQVSNKQTITKEDLKEMFRITQSERERELIRYAIYKTSGATPTEIRHTMGFENMQARAERVESSIKEAEEIYEAIDALAQAKDKALLYSLGIQCSSSSGSSDQGSDEETQYGYCSTGTVNACLPEDSSLAAVLQECEFNWFEFYERVEGMMGECDDVNALLEGFFLRVAHMGFAQTHMDLTVQSHDAFASAVRESYEEERMARYINGEIVSESESDNPEEYIGVTNVIGEAKTSLIVKKRAAIKRRARRMYTKTVTEKRFLSRKLSKRTSKIIRDCPNIGETIESFVEDHNVGADAWRRTGILTFDGNANLKVKVTYKNIQQHLEHVYGRNFAYGTVVELCVARNKRRLSSKRYRGLAKVTSRRARKGFNLKFNPDSHWSAAFYKALNQIQLQDGRNVLFVNRDDATGFRLDTLTTCKQYAAPTVKGKEILTTRTDYVNRYHSILQTSYNFTRTCTTPETCVGIVKAVPIHKKNPAQHFSDLVMLSTEPDLKSVFANFLSGTDKEIDCIRVDGATDEGPSHEVVQYWWTEWHFRKKKAATLVTSRSSGSSYLNRVELQNG